MQIVDATEHPVGVFASDHEEAKVMPWQRRGVSSGALPAVLPHEHQRLANIISTSMGAAAATNVRPHVHHVEGHDLCRVQVDACGFPVDAKVIYQEPNGAKESRSEFFVRVANGTKSLDVVEREKYILSRWNSTA